MADDEQPEGASVIDIPESVKLSLLIIFLSVVVVWIAVSTLYFCTKLADPTQASVEPGKVIPAGLVVFSAVSAVLLWIERKTPELRIISLGSSFLQLSQTAPIATPAPQAPVPQDDGVKPKGHDSENKGDKVLSEPSDPGKIPSGNNSDEKLKTAVEAFLKKWKGQAFNAARIAGWGKSVGGFNAPAGTVSDVNAIRQALEKLADEEVVRCRISAQTGNLLYSYKR